MDGSKLPLVIFTTDKSVPDDIDRDFDGHVVVRDHKGAESSTLTLAYFDKIQLGSMGIRLLLHDNGPGFKNKQTQDFRELHDIQLIELLRNLAYLTNPCDNSLHSSMKSFYYQRPHTNHCSSLKDILTCYERVKATSVKGYFRKCLLTPGSDISNDNVVDLVCAGFHPEGLHRAEHVECLAKYKLFKSGLRIDGISASSPPATGSLQCELDGIYWV